MAIRKTYQMGARDFYKAKRGITRLQAKARGRFQRRRKPQARFNFSKRRYGLNKAISNAMRNMSETKLIPCANINPGASNGTPTQVIGTGSNATAFRWAGVLQSIPTGWEGADGTVGVNSLAGMTIPQGTSSGQHVGNYVYLRKTHLNFQVDGLMATTNKPVLQIRLIVAKARQGVQPAGTTSYPQNTLFLNQAGNEQGHASTGNQAMNTFEVMNNPLNKRDWVILKDRRFYLSQPVNIPALDGSTGVGYNQKYPVRHNFRLDLPHFVKAKIGGNGSPVDYDARYIVYMYATAVGATTNTYLPDNWRVAMRGTTSYTDN